MYPIPSIRMKALKSEPILVSCMKLASHSDGSTSMYEENNKVTTMVTTKGTRFDVRKDLTRNGRRKSGCGLTVM